MPITPTRRLVLPDTKVADVITVKEAARLFAEQGKIVGYATGTGHAMLIRTHPKQTRGGLEKRYGFIYLHAPQNAPIFADHHTPADAIAAVMENSVSSQRELSVYDTVAELLSVPLVKHSTTP